MSDDMDDDYEGVAETTANDQPDDNDDDADGEVVASKPRRCARGVASSRPSSRAVCSHSKRGVPAPMGHS